MSWQPNAKLAQNSRAFIPFLLRELHAPLVVALLALQTALALLLASRAILAPLSKGAPPSSTTGGLLAWVVVAALLAAATRWTWFHGARRRSPALDVAARYLPLAAVAITAVSAPLAGAGLVGTAVAWLLLAAEEWMSLGAIPVGRFADRWQMFRRAWPDALRRGAPPRNRAAETSGPNAQASTVSPGADRTTRSPDLVASPPMSPDADCVQRLTRVQAIDGRDRLEGSLSTRLVAGQTTAQLHVAFCPSFVRVPTLDFRQAGGPRVKIKLGQLLPHGARFEVKLPEPAAAALQVTLEMVAHHAPDHATSPHLSPSASAPF